MSEFSERLRAEIEYKGLLQKEVAALAGIKKRALDMYLGSQGSIPPVDVAVKLATVLDVSVEYLVTGKTTDNRNADKYLPVREIMDELLILPPEVLTPIKAMIHAAAQAELEKNKTQVQTS